ncbi:gamma-glutamylcyclotransferase family protein [Bacillus sp. FJAT-44742]|uniref:gamma-glutamylcyclotransferase family protein n=1 Tax=Bacillus sp. FJAT-44742 TaxID=2014005 RepID=UPI000C23EB20|nr:gamma-glutamylcyclotransferase family protein [Bacillus sp. FJAT-44742]
MRKLKNKYRSGKEKNHQVKAQIPFFVYGTLRPGLYNYESFIRGKTIEEVPAIAKGVLYSVTGGAFPCMRKGEEKIKGDLLYISPEYYEEVQKNLDLLEGYDPEQPEGSDYVRRTIIVESLSGKKTKAYTYYWNHPAGTAEHVSSGCWITHIHERKK